MEAIGLLLMLTEAASLRAGPPVQAATGDPGQLALFPSSLQRMPTGALLLIAQGNPDEEMPLGGWGRAWATDNASDLAGWRPVGPQDPRDGSPRKGVLCTHRPDGTMPCLPFRLDPSSDPREATAAGLLWRSVRNATGVHTFVAGQLNISVRLDVAGLTNSEGHWSFVPDMDKSIPARPHGQPAQIATLYGAQAGPGPGAANSSLVAIVSRDFGQSWTQLALIKNSTGLDDTPTGPCSTPSENALVRLPDQRLAAFYRNRDGPETGWSANVALCVQFSADEGLHWSAPRQVGAGGPHGVEPKAAVLGSSLVVLSGRYGLYARYTDAGLGLEDAEWSVFNIAAHHNVYYGDSVYRFSNDTVNGSGGNDETTGYMGLLPAVDGQSAVVCYDRTTTHMHTERHYSGPKGPQHQNVVFCFEMYAN